MIKGKHVFFRPVEYKDLDVMRSWLNDPEISSLVVGWNFPVSLAQQEKWFERNIIPDTTHRWIVESEEMGVLGLTGLWQIDWQSRQALTGLKLGNKDIRGKGYGTDSIMALMAYAFLEVGLHRLWAEIIDYNIASYRAYVQKCGWKVEGVLRDAIYREGQYHDLLRVAILKDEFLAHPQSQDYIPNSLKSGDIPRIIPLEADVAPSTYDWFAKSRANG